jgi:putative FmdB family regulatory protein
MPIYAYRCSACGHAKDVLQRMSDPLLSTCPVCAAETFTKQVTAAGFQLKGSGWYATDFKGGAAAPTAEAKSEAKAGGTSGGDSANKTDTKSDATSGSKADGKPAAAAAVSTTAPSAHGGGSCACH